ncbi:MAG: OmpH family outer membrane protein [Armatimonadetes bacterium]|nr:OmpH family outer membrane protein [Armatimonadota bacterium]
MMNIRSNKLGWIVACGLLGGLVATGFQAGTEKVGVVDISKVVEDSDFGKANQAAFKKMKGVRESLLEFIDQNRILTNEQALRLKELALKDSPSAAETAESERIKADVVQAAKRNAELNAKQNLTAEDRTLLEDYARRAQTMDQLERRWYTDFTTEMQNWADKQKLASVDKARAAVQKVAREQGFTVVFEAGIAPYGANDISAACLQAMNAVK